MGAGFSPRWPIQQCSEFANAMFAVTTKTNSISRKKDKAMKTKVIQAIIAVTQSQWMRAALMTLAILVGVVGVTGCSHPH